MRYALVMDSEQPYRQQLSSHLQQRFPQYLWYAAASPHEACALVRRRRQEPSLCLYTSKQFPNWKPRWTDCQNIGLRERPEAVELHPELRRFKSADTSPKPCPQRQDYAQIRSRIRALLEPGSDSPFLPSTEGLRALLCCLPQQAWPAILERRKREGKNPGSAFLLQLSGRQDYAILPSTEQRPALEELMQGLMQAQDERAFTFLLKKVFAHARCQGQIPQLSRSCLSHFLQHPQLLVPFSLALAQQARELGGLDLFLAGLPQASLRPLLQFARRLEICASAYSLRQTCVQDRILNLVRELPPGLPVREWCYDDRCLAAGQIWEGP